MGSTFLSLHYHIVFSLSEYVFNVVAARATERGLQSAEVLLLLWQ